MSIVIAVGATCFGIVIGLLVRYFLRRFETYTPQILGTVISIIAGGSAVSFFDTNKSAIWFYPIGLLIGFISYSIVAYRVRDDVKGSVFYIEKEKKEEEHKDS